MRRFKHTAMLAGFCFLIGGCMALSPMPEPLVPKEADTAKEKEPIAPKDGGSSKENEPEAPKAPEPAKTLFEWSIGPDDKPKAPEEPEKREPITTDRPDFTEASSTVGKGVIQLEAGYTFFRDRSNGVKTDQHSYPEALFRIGMFADWFELRLGQNLGTVRNKSLQITEGFSGTEDFYLGTKLFLTEQKSYLPESSVILQMNVPTGHREFTGNRVQPGINYLYGWDVIEDCLSFAGSTQANLSVDDVDHSYLELAQSFTIGYTLTEKLGAYTEWFAFFPSGALAPGVSAQHYLDGGFTYKVTDDFQLDIRGGVGLSRQAQDFFLGTGFAVRF